MLFVDTLLRWYEENRRDLPWRGEDDPYKIWVSEIILQQTRIKQGWEYYLHFIEKFPDIASLAFADSQDVLKVWQGLGYYSRARNMQEAARSIMENHNGEFPRHYDDILKLKGIGEYTASAIASMAYGLPYAAVDGNVFRIICRIFGIFDNILSPSTKQKVTAKCLELMGNAKPGDFNQAMMDFGSLQCTPRNPNCEECPFRKDCYAFKNEAVGKLPVKIKSNKIRKRYFHYFCFLKEDRVMVRQRTGNDILKGLFEFPLMESGEIRSDEIEELLRRYCHSGEPDWQIKHHLSHQTIFAFFYIIRVNEFPLIQDKDTIIKTDRIPEFPFPKIIAEFIENKIVG